MNHEPILASLRQWGADPVEGVARCVGDTELYVTCLRSFAWDQNFETLFSAQTNPQRLEAAHTLKGVAGNLSLTPLFDVLSLMVAELRSGAANRLEEQIQQTQQLQTQLQCLFH